MSRMFIYRYTFAMVIRLVVNALLDYRKFWSEIVVVKIEPVDALVPLHEKKAKRAEGTLEMS